MCGRKYELNNVREYRADLGDREEMRELLKENFEKVFRKRKLRKKLRLIF